MPSWLLLTALVASILIPTALIMWLIMWAAARHARAETQQQMEFERQLDQEIRDLSVAGARARAEALLADPSRFACTPAARPDDARLEPLAPLVREFFEKYESVEDPDGREGPVWGLFSLSREEIQLCEGDPRLIEIGRYSDAEDNYDALAVQPGEEPIYFLNWPDPSEELESRFPSIYHYLLYADGTRLWLQSPSERA
jgi:hypothetical protein